MATRLLDAIERHSAVCLQRVHRRLLQWTKPTTGTLARGMIADATKSKATLHAAKNQAACNVAPIGLERKGRRYESCRDPVASISRPLMRMSFDSSR